MGPQRSLSGMTEDVNIQTDVIRKCVARMRAANRRLTGGTGEPPTQLAVNNAGSHAPTVAEAPPLMVALTIAIEANNAAVSDLVSEIDYFENLSETGSLHAAKLSTQSGTGTFVTRL